jgi:hypothetical protein
VTAVGFAPLEGALRVRPAEDAWAGVLASAGVDPATLPAAIAPREPASPVDLAPEVGHAATLLAGPAPLLVEARSRTEDLGLLALVASDGAVCASGVRRVAVEGAGLAPLPGVELSVYGVESLLDELVRLLPPLPGELPEHAGPTEVALPLEAAVMLSRALAEGDADLAAQVADLAGLEEVPPLVESLAHRLLGEAAVAVSAPATGFRTLRTWLLCSLGWVALHPQGDVVVHRLVTADEVRDDLVFDLTGAITAAATSPEGGSDG